MSTFYVKLEDNYCIMSPNTVPVEALSFIQYLMDYKIIDDPAIKASYELLIKDTSKDFHHIFQYPLIIYRLAKTKNSSNNVKEYTKEKITNNYLTLIQMQQHYDILIKIVKKYEKQLKALTTEEFKPYFNYDDQAYYYEYNKTHFKVNNNHSTRAEKEKIIAQIHEEFKQLHLGNLFNFKNVLKNPFVLPIQKWEKVLDKQGQPLVIEEENAISKFNEKEGYAIFCQDKRYDGSSGFWGSTNSALTDINQAKLFQNEAQVDRYIKQTGFKNVAVVKVNVKFQEVIKKIGVVDTTDLEAVKSAQEKAHIEALLQEESNIEKMLYQIIEQHGQDRPQLKQELESFLADKIKKSGAKKEKKKI